MKRILCRAAALTVTIAISACQSPHDTYALIKNPECATLCDGLSVLALELTDTATWIHFHAHVPAGHWIAIAPGAHLESDGKRMPMLGANGVVPGNKLWIDRDGGHRFSLSFSPVPRSASSIDFIEGSGDGHWRIDGIKLNR